MFVVEYRLIIQLASLFQNKSFTNQRAKRISRFIDFKKYRVSEQFAMCFGTSCTGLAVPSGAGVVSALYTNCVIYILLLGCYIVQYPRKIFFITPERTYLWSEKKWKIEVKKTPNRRDSSHLNNPQPSFRVPKRNRCQGEIRVYYLHKRMFTR